MIVADLFQSCGNERQRFVPRRLAEATVFLDERRLQSILAREKIESELTFHTKGPFVHHTLQVRGYADPQIRWAVRRNLTGPVEELAGEWREGRYYFDLPGPGVYLVLLGVTEADSDVEILHGTVIVKKKAE